MYTLVHSKIFFRLTFVYVVLLNEIHMYIDNTPIYINWVHQIDLDK